MAEEKRFTITRSAETQAFVDSLPDVKIFSKEIFDNVRLPQCWERDPYTELVVVGMDGRPFTFANPLDETMYGRAHVYTFTPESYSRIIIFVHGGGYIFNANGDYAVTCDRYCSALDAKVIMPMYPLTPQGTWEECYQLVEQVYQEALAEDKPILFFGHSAGGGIALGFTEELIETGKPLPEKLVLFSPWIEVELENPHIAEHAPIDPFLSCYGLVRAGKFWAGQLDTADRRISPKNYEHLDKLPQMFISVGTNEIFYSDITEFYEAVVEAGNEATLLVGENLFHEYPMFATLPESGDVRKLVVDFVK